MDAKERLIVALDVPNLTKAKTLVDDLGDSVSFYKVGMELFYGAGPDVVRYLKEKNKKVFLDLKLQDIPNTVAHALQVLTTLGADILNVHTVGGPKMMAEGAKAVKKTAAQLGKPAPKLIGVTVLTSMDTTQWQPLHYGLPIGEEVLELAVLAKQSGLNGVVASPQEAAGVCNRCGKDFLIVTPGVRPAWAATNDQSRIATPSAALQAGATHLVVGRPITQAADKKAAAEKVLEEMEGALE